MTGAVQCIPRKLPRKLQRFLWLRQCRILTTLSMRAVFASLPFLVGFATLFPWSNDGKFMLPAEVIAQAADVVIGLFAVMIFLMVDVIGGSFQMEKYRIILEMGCRTLIRNRTGQILFLLCCPRMKMKLLFLP